MKLFKFLKSEKGFTLIELLVVIGVLGILATGLLATIDPLEQFRKGQDSNERTSALELNNALTRYYSTHNAFPWDAVNSGGQACNGGAAPAATQVTGQATGVTTSFNDCLTDLVGVGELKNSFPTQNSILYKLYVTDTTPAGTTSRSIGICFHPDSKGMQKDPQTKYSQNPTGAACDPTTSTACYWCAL